VYASKHDPNDRLAIKGKKNRISYVAYISKQLDAIHATQPNILYVTVIMAQFANDLQDNWPGVKRIIEIFERNYRFCTHLWRCYGSI
jgi:hypothetical protein